MFVLFLLVFGIYQGNSKFFVLINEYRKMNEEVDDFVRFLKKIYRIFWKWVYFIFKGNFIFKLKKKFI